MTIPHITTFTAISVATETTSLDGTTTPSTSIQTEPYTTEKETTTITTTTTTEKFSFCSSKNNRKNDIEDVSRKCNASKIFEVLLK